MGTVGVIRSGKTAIDTLLGLIEAEKDNTEVYANYPIKHSKIKMMNTVDDFINLKFDEMNGLAIIQEFQVWIESRLSGKEITRVIDKTILQSGKLGFDILWDAQLSSSIDKRARLNTTNWFSTRRKIPLLKWDNAFMFRYLYLSERLKLTKFNFSNWPALKTNVLDMYDTKAIAELKRNFEQVKKEGGEINKGTNDYEKQNTVTLTQPNGDEIDAATPQIKDTKLGINNPLIAQLEESGMEIVS